MDTLSSTQPAGPVEADIREKLTAAFCPQALQVTNESFMHSVPPGSESHFKVVVVSEAFQDKNLVARHRAVNQALSTAIANGLHALSIEARTPQEWSAINGRTTDSPACLGGSKAE